jgi:hypothetical protein
MLRVVNDASHGAKDSCQGSDSGQLQEQKKE